MARLTLSTRALACGALALFASACAGQADVPETPDLRSLLSQYTDPTAALDEQSVNDVFDMARELDLGALAAGFNTLSASRPGLNGASSALNRDSGSAVDLQGSLHVTVTCPGDGAEPTLDAKTNGTLEATLGVDNTQILRGVRMEAHACRARPTYAGRSVNAFLDGPILLDLGKNLGAGQGTVELLVSVVGEIRIDDITFSSVNGRLTRDSFESLFVLPGNQQTVVLTVREGEGIGIRDRESFWHCTLDPLECSRD